MIDDADGIIRRLGDIQAAEAFAARHFSEQREDAGEGAALIAASRHPIAPRSGGHDPEHKTIFGEIGRRSQAEAGFLRARRTCR